MSADTPRSIGRTPRQVAGPGVERDVDDDLADEPDGLPDTDAPRDPHPIAADPGDVDRLRAEDDVVDVRDPDMAPADEPPPAHLTDPRLDEGADEGDDGPGTQPAHAAEAVPEPDAVPDDGPPFVPEPVAGEVEPEPVVLDEREPDALDEPDMEPEPVVLAGPDPEPEPRPESEPAVLDEPAPGPEPDADLVPVPGADVEPDSELPAGFMGDTAALRDRWESVQVGFVDDPRHAVEEAHEMVAAAVAELQAQIDRQRDELAGSWRHDAAASTDALLSAFQGYRELFERVLAV